MNGCNVNGNDGSFSFSVSDVVASKKRYRDTVGERAKQVKTPLSICACSQDHGFTVWTQLTTSLEHQGRSVNSTSNTPLCNRFSLSYFPLSSVVGPVCLHLVAPLAVSSCPGKEARAMQDRDLPASLCVPPDGLS